MIYRETPVMGRGNVAVGECRNPGTNMCGIIYLRLDEPKNIGEVCQDVYPSYSRPDQDKILACVYFSTLESIQQTIELLQQIRDENFPQVFDTLPIERTI